MSLNISPFDMCYVTQENDSEIVLKKTLCSFLNIHNMDYLVQILKIRKK